ncbi:MAG: hypothetical protein KDA58_02765, partial [Planctomycetaceae bacterium]|nr:hypothetical protein [Planctomycetaceae bacterium]
QRFPGFQLLPDARRDLVLSEVLVREAERLKINLPEDAVIEYIKDATNDKMTSEVFKEIREALGSSDKAIVSALRRELLIQTTANVIYGNKFLTPVSYYDYYRQLNVKQSAELVSLPVSSFEEGLPEPSAAELQQLFDQYKSNSPNFTPEGRYEEGRPGFVQPRRVRLAYLEAAFEDIKATVGEVTDEEVQQVYEERYKKPLPVMTPAEGSEGAATGGPALPGTTPAGEEKPAESDKPAAGEKPANGDKPAAPATEDKPTDEAKPGTEDKPAEEKPAEEKPAEPAAEAEKPAESTESTGNETSALPARSLSLVALFDDAPATDADKPAAEAPTEDKPADEKPAEAGPAEEKPADAPAEEKPAAETKPTEGDSKPAEGADKPATEEKPAGDAKPADGDKPAEEKPATGDKPAEGTPPAGDDVVPPAPTSEVRPLDDALKAEIREDILRERTHTKMRAIADAAMKFMSDKGFNHTLEESDAKYLSAEELSTLLEGFAEKNGLIYVETPLLTTGELTSGEDYPIGSAFCMDRQPMLAGERVFRMGPNDLYRPISAHNFRTDSEFIFWKSEDKAAHVPESLEDELVHKQVVATWKRLQALPKAEERANQLITAIKESDKPLSELFAEETVTGDKESLYLTVKETGPFTWMQRSTAAPQNMMQRPQVRPSSIPGAEDAGQRFMAIVCNEMEVGEARAIPNEDGSAIYIVRLVSREPEATPEAAEAFRKEFLAAGNMMEYGQLGQLELSEHSGHLYDWADSLLASYGVDITEPAGAE